MLDLSRPSFFVRKKNSKMELLYMATNTLLDTLKLLVEVKMSRRNIEFVFILPLVKSPNVLKRNIRYICMVDLVTLI